MFPRHPAGQGSVAIAAGAGERACLGFPLPVKDCVLSSRCLLVPWLYPPTKPWNMVLSSGGVQHVDSGVPQAGGARSGLQMLTQSPCSLEEETPPHASLGDLTWSQRTWACPPPV